MQRCGSGAGCCPAAWHSLLLRTLNSWHTAPAASHAGILLHSAQAGDDIGGGEDAEEGAGVLQQGCAMVGCQPEGLEHAIRLLLGEQVQAARDRAAAEGGSKRPRRQQQQAEEAGESSEA